MVKLQRVERPRTRRVKRILEKREPLTTENSKQALFVHGRKTSDVVRSCLKDLHALKREFSIHLQQKNDILPFEDPLPLERLSQKHDASLFAYCSHSKKRPDNIVLARTYDHHILDMFEFAIKDYHSLSSFACSKVSAGTKPCLVFCGHEFDDEKVYQRLKSLFIDFFRGVEATALRLHGFEHALLFTALEGNIFFRSYKISSSKFGTDKPRIELTEIGPSFTLVQRRSSMASDSLFKIACKQPKELKIKKQKNIMRNTLGTKLGRVHMIKQDIGKLQTRKVRALKKNKEKKPD